MYGCCLSCAAGECMVHVSAKTIGPDDPAYAKIYRQATKGRRAPVTVDSQICPGCESRGPHEVLVPSNDEYKPSLLECAECGLAFVEEI